MNLKIVIVLLLAVNSLIQAGQPYWVFFDPDPLAPAVQLSEKTEQRLEIRGIAGHRGSQQISMVHLASLRDAGFKIRHSSRFLNAVSIEVENAVELEILKHMPFVKSTSPVARHPERKLTEMDSNPQLQRISRDNYGQSYTQNQMLNIPKIHNYGYDGSGVIIGVFDTGFYPVHPTFDQLNILAQYDFVDHEPDPAGSGHEHGINTLSLLGGFSAGELIGSAYGASYLLARTEDNDSETRAEEDNWVAALEWADSLGVDIISSSLNYFQQHDDPEENYPLSALDGETTIITRAANIAAERGILVVNSAGNEGPSASSIWPPADSRHVLSVGAINSQGQIASFSGRGPTFDGRLKPSIVAMGQSVYMASGTSAFKLANGTSFSTPLVAGLAALLLQANPGLTPDSMISIFEDLGSLGHFPNNNYGHGIPDISSLFLDLKLRSSHNCLVYPNPATNREINMVLRDAVADNIAVARLFDIRGREIAILSVTPKSTNITHLVLPESLDLASQLIILSVESEGKIYSGKFVYIRS